MRPVVEFVTMWSVETTRGIELVPDDLVGTDPTLGALMDFCEGTPLRDAEPELVTGYFCRLSAPGYMDCTEWTGPFATEVGARLYLADTYDIDPYTGEEADAND